MRVLCCLGVGCRCVGEVVVVLSLGLLLGYQWYAARHSLDGAGCMAASCAHEPKGVQTARNSR